MKITVNTKKLNDALSKASKGVGSGKVLPITSYFKLEGKNKALYVTATTLSNYITEICKDVEGDDGFLAVIKADQLVKLVSKTTKETISFEVSDKNLLIKGNGSYSVEILQETFKDYEFDREAPSVEVDIASLKTAFAINKYSLAKDMVVPCLAGYHAAEKCISTDGVKMCINSIELFKEPVLISQELADLLGTLEGGKVKVQKNEGRLLFTTDTAIIFGTELEGKDTYPDISAVLDFEYESSCQISRDKLIDALDRLALFIDPYDNNGAKLKFQEGILIISDIKENSHEELPYIESTTHKDYEANVNIEYLKELITAVDAPIAKLHYGNDIAIKIEDENVVQILCLISDEENK